MEAVFFYMFGGLAVLMVFLMILLKNPVSSALCLVFALFNLAALFILLNASFIGILQVLVYGGAIMVLFVFMIMLLNLDKEKLKDHFTLSKSFYFILGFAFLFFIGSQFFLAGVGMPEQEITQNFGSPKAVSHILFEKHFVALQLTGILLLVAIIGVVVLGRKKI